MAWCHKKLIQSNLRVIFESQMLTPATGIYWKGRKIWYIGDQVFQFAVLVVRPIQNRNANCNWLLIKNKKSTNELNSIEFAWSFTFSFRLNKKIIWSTIWMISSVPFAICKCPNVSSLAKEPVMITNIAYVIEKQELNLNSVESKSNPPSSPP